MLLILSKDKLIILEVWN